MEAIELAPKLLEGAPTRDQSVELFGLSPGAKVQPKRSTLRSPAGFNAA